MLAGGRKPKKDKPVNYFMPTRNNIYWFEKQLKCKNKIECLGTKARKSYARQTTDTKAK